MKHRVLFGFLILWFCLCSSLFWMIYTDAKEKAIDELNSRQLLHASQARIGIEDFFAKTVEHLTQISRSEHVIDLDDEGRRELDFALKINTSELLAITRVDQSGAIVYTAPYHEALIGKDISRQKHIQKILRTQKPVVSDVINAVQNHCGIALHVPVFKDKKFYGSLGILIDFQSISKFFLENIRIGITGYAWMTSSEGVELYCPVPGHTGKSVFENCKEFPDIISMANEMLKGRKGKTTYTYNQIRNQQTKIIKKHAVYVPIKIADSFWSIVVASSEDEVLATLVGLYHKLIFIFILIVLGGVFFLYFGLKAWGIVRENEARNKAEAALRESEERFKLTMETSPAGIVRVDARGLTIYANQQAEKILGIRQKDGTGRFYNEPEWKITDFNGDPFPKENLPFAVVQKTGKPVFGIRHAIEGPGGKQVLLSINSAPLLDAQGTFEGMVATVEDITDKYQAEQNYQTLFREMIDGFALHEIIRDEKGHPVDYRFIAVNPAFERMTGLQGVSLIGKSVLEVMPKTEFYWIETYGQVALTGNPVFFENYSQEIGRYFQVTAFRPAKNQFACFFVDVTKRKLTEKALWESTERFQKIFNSQLDAIFVLDAGLPARILDCNPAAAKIFGYQADEMFHETVDKLHINQSNLKIFQQMLSDAIQKDGHLSDFQFSMKRKNGTVFPSEHTVLELKNNADERTGWVSIVRDLTERKQIEKRLQQAQKMESIGNLAGGIAHDFNNILSPIIGLSELMLEDLYPGSPEYENVQQILNAGKRGSDLVKQILVFSRQSEQKIIPVRIQQILREVIKLSRSTIPSNIEIIQEIQDSCGPVMADPTQIHQIVMNLVTNAYHAVEETEGKIIISLKETGSGGEGLSGKLHEPERLAMLSISDTGCGIEPEVMDKIFEPYFTTKKQGKGTGLGLSVVYGIVKAYKGDIKVFSEIGKGTTFLIYLPIMEQPYEIKEAEPWNKNPAGTETILLVDDEESIVRLEKKILERLGYQVISRTGSVEALEAFRHDPEIFDLVITDMAMPKMTGENLAGELLSIRPDIPIIVCTGFSERINSERIKALGIKGLLMKPVIKSDMINMVRRVLDEVNDSAKDPQSQNKNEFV